MDITKESDREKIDLFLPNIDYVLAHSQCVNIYSGYTYSVMRGYRMYNMYCRDLAVPIYYRITKKP